MARQEVRMEMGEEDMADGETVTSRRVEILLYVALRVHHGGRTARRIADHIRSVREAIEVELLEDHAVAPGKPGGSAFCLIWVLLEGGRGARPLQTRCQATCASVLAANPLRL